MSIKEKLFEEDHPDLALTFNNLATLLHEKKDHEGAESMYRRAIAITEESLGPEHQQLVVFLYNLAALLEGLGQKDEAEALEARAQNIEQV